MNQAGSTPPHCGVTSAGALDFEVSESELEQTGQGYGIKLTFAKTMDDEAVKAAFDKGESVLTVTIGFA